MRDPFIHKQSFNRSNLTYSVRKKEAKTIINDIADIITSRKHQTGIVYCLSKKDSEEVCDSLGRMPTLKDKGQCDVM